MRILVVAATAPEIAPLDAVLTTPPNGHTIDVLLTGVGMVATAAHCARRLQQTPYDVAFNFGVCGAFDPATALGTVVHVVSDRFPELGVEDGDRFVTMQELKLIGANEFPYCDGALTNPEPPDNPVLARLRQVKGITVNTVHGHPRSIAGVVHRFHPDVESMEGAAFMFACLIHRVPFAQVRAVSNLVERRNRQAWKLDLAIQRLAETAQQILTHA